MTGTMSPSGEIWPMKPRSVSPKWMFSSRPRVGESPFAMYCRRISSGVAPFTSIDAEVADQRRQDVARSSAYALPTASPPGRASETARRRPWSGGTARRAAPRACASDASSSRARASALASAGLTAAWRVAGYGAGSAAARPFRCAPICRSRQVRRPHALPASRLLRPISIRGLQRVRWVRLAMQRRRRTASRSGRGGSRRSGRSRPRRTCSGRPRHAPTASARLTCRRTSASRGAWCRASPIAGKNASAACMTAAGVRCVRKKWRIAVVTGRTRLRGVLAGSSCSTSCIQSFVRCSFSSNRGGTGPPSPIARRRRRSASCGTCRLGPSRTRRPCSLRSSFVAKMRPSLTIVDRLPRLLVLHDHGVLHLLAARAAATART